MPTASTGTVLVNSTADLGRMGQAPVTLIVLDELNMTFADRAYARTRLIEWLKRQPAVLPQPTALLAIDDKNLHLLRDYTQARDALLAILQKHAGNVVWRMDPNSTSASMQENMGAVLAAIDQPGAGHARHSRPQEPALGRPRTPCGRHQRCGRAEPPLGQRAVALCRRPPDAGAGHAQRHRSNAQRIGGQPLQLHAVPGRDPDARRPDADRREYVGLQQRRRRSQILCPIGRVRRPQLQRAQRNISTPRSAAASMRAAPTTPSFTAPPMPPAIPRGLSQDSRHGHPAGPHRSDPRRLLRAAAAARSLREGVEPSQFAYDLNSAAISPIAYTDLHLTAERGSRGNFTLHATARDLTWHDLSDGRRHADIVLLAACLSPRGRLLARASPRWAPTPKPRSPPSPSRPPHCPCTSPRRPEPRASASSRATSPAAASAPSTSHPRIIAQWNLRQAIAVALARWRGPRRGPCWRTQRTRSLAPNPRPAPRPPECSPARRS